MKLQQGAKYPKADFFSVTHNGHNLFLELSSLPEMAATSGLGSTLCLVGQGIVLCCDRVFSTLLDSGIYLSNVPFFFLGR